MVLEGGLFFNMTNNREDRKYLVISIIEAIKSGKKTIPQIQSVISPMMHQQLRYICRKLSYTGILSKYDKDHGYNLLKEVDNVDVALGYKYAGEMKIIKCVKCLENKNRIYSEKEFGKIVYVDENKKRWKNQVCPSCYNKSFRTEDLRFEPLTKRKCRGCSKSLPESRYYNCYECQPDLPIENDEYIYHGIGLEEIEEYEHDLSQD